MRRRGGKGFSLPLNVYLYALVAAMMLLLALFGWFTLEEIRHTASRLDGLERRLAREEFTRALAETGRRLRETAATLAAWDEVHQQLQDPTYYTYWHMHRLRKPGNLPDFVIEAGLYDRQGNPLARLHADPLPPRLPAEAAPVVWREGDRILLRMVHPVPAGPSSPPGYLVLLADLLQAIRRNFNFARMDPASLKVESVPAEPVPLERLGALLHPAPRPTPARAEFLHAVERSMIRLTVLLVLLGLAQLLFFSFLVRRPLAGLGRFLQRLRRGEPAGTAAVGRPLPVAELEEIRSSLEEYHRQLESARSSLDERNRELWELAHKDPLTGAWNRRAFERDWKNLRALLEGSRMEIAFLLFDCDHFKAINDSYGHQVGDEVIRITARRIQQVLRKGDKLYRLGGDEFATVALECDCRCAERLAERCLAAMREEDFSRLGIHEPVNLSIGIAVSDATRLPDLSELKRRADMAMYHAKRPGTHHVCLHDPGMEADEGMLYSSRAIHAVQEAIRHGRGIEMHYQPVLDLATERPAYLEALARLRAGETLLVPAQFLPIVEAHRLEEEFDLAVLRTLERELEGGRLASAPGISVNLSAGGLLSPRVMDLLERLARHAGRPELLLEITETTLITRLQDATRRIRSARALGYRIALDDFGSGYSSLRYLASMPVDIVKFDGAMTRRIVEGGRQREMIEGIVRIIRRAGYRTVAEGVEDRDALQAVRAAGFRYGQGYLFGPPAPAARPAASGPS